MFYIWNLHASFCVRQIQIFCIYANTVFRVACLPRIRWFKVLRPLPNHSKTQHQLIYFINTVGSCSSFKQAFCSVLILKVDIHARATSPLLLLSFSPLHASKKQVFELVLNRSKPVPQSPFHFKQVVNGKVVELFVV